MDRAVFESCGFVYGFRAAKQPAPHATPRRAITSSLKTAVHRACAITEDSTQGLPCTSTLPTVRHSSMPTQTRGQRKAEAEDQFDAKIGSVAFYLAVAVPLIFLHTVCQNLGYA